MKTIIYYFSGTGNSKLIATKLSEVMKDSCTESITDVKQISNAESIGFVFPVYMWGVPTIIENFIANLPDNMNLKYVFAIATYKSQTGNVMGQLKKLLELKHIELSAGFRVKMPGNNIVYYSPESKENQIKIINRALIKTRQIADKVNCMSEEKSPLKMFKEKSYFEKIHKGFVNSFLENDKNYWVTNDCNNCGKCKKICPMDNIEINDGKITWKHNCMQCLACINSCPYKAIQYGKSTVKRDRYINPLA